MMVAKEIDPFKSHHAYEQAGQTAMERIAATLKIGFKTAPKSLTKTTIRLFHGFRLDNGSYAVQFDHLIVHQYGVILIENRAEPADVRVNPLGEWTQIYNAAELRISSPVTQGERKLGYLKSFLEENISLFLPNRKTTAVFSPLPFDMLIAISDEGEFSTAPGMNMPRVCRSADTAKRLISLIEQQRNAAKKRLGLGYHKEKMLSGDEVFKVTSFLRAQHKMLEREEPIPRIQSEASEGATEASPNTLKAGQDDFRCTNCGCPQLAMDHEGGYRLMCMDCGVLMTIDRTCQYCSRQAFISRNGNEYFLECEACLRVELIFVEPVR